MNRKTLQRISPRLQSIARRYGQSMAEDVFQEMVIAILEGRKKGTDAYLIQAGKFEAQHWTDREIVRDRTWSESDLAYLLTAGRMDDADDEQDQSIIDVIAADEQGCRQTEESVIHAEMRERIRSAIEGLTDRQRTVAYLLLRGRSISEIADALGSKRQAICNRIARMRPAFLDIE